MEWLSYKNSRIYFSIYFYVLKFKEIQPNPISSRRSLFLPVEPIHSFIRTPPTPRHVTSKEIIFISFTTRGIPTFLIKFKCRLHRIGGTERGGRNETSFRHLTNDRIVIPFVFVRPLCQNRNRISLIVASLIIIQSTNYILSWHPNSESHRVHGLIIKTRVLDWDAVRQPPYDRVQPTNIEWSELDPYYVEPSYLNYPLLTKYETMLLPSMPWLKMTLVRIYPSLSFFWSLVDHATILLITICYQLIDYRAKSHIS